MRPGRLFRAFPAARGGSDGERDQRQNWWDTLGRNSAQADAAGRYTFDQVAPGRYRLAVKHARGYQPFEGEAFDLRAGETRIEDIELRKAAAISVRVLLPDGEPAVGAALSFAAERNDQGGVGYGVDSAGRFRHESATPGPVWLRVLHPGYPELLREIEVLPGENAFELVLEAGGIELEARVADREGAPVAGARAMLAGPHQNEATSDAAGRTRFSGLDRGTYRLMIDKEGYVFPPQELAVEASRRDFEWTLERAAFRLKGAVLGLAEGCADVYVWVARPDHGPAFGRCENGAYLVEGLVAGNSTLIATHAGSRVVVRTIEIPPQGAEEIELDVDFRTLAGPWSGRLRLGEQDLRNVRYSLESGLGSLLSGFSADGKIELYAEPGRYRLSVRARPMEEPKQIEIVIGSPSEQLIDASEP